MRSLVEAVTHIHTYMYVVRGTASNTVRRMRTISSLDPEAQEYTKIGDIVRTVSSIIRF